MTEEANIEKKKNKMLEEVDKAEDVFSLLMRTMPPVNLQATIDKAEADQIRGYRFKEGITHIIVARPPKALKDKERFKYSDNGIGYIGSIKELKQDVIGNNEYPITYTEKQFWELVGQTKVHFPLWTPSIDPAFDVLRGIKVIADTQSFFVDEEKKEKRTKTRFEIDESYESYKERCTWLSNKTEEVSKKAESVEIGKATEELKQGW